MQPRPIVRVLVVDDEFEMATMIADELEDRGYTTLALCSGREALMRVQRESFDAIVTDLRMPDIDGLELLRKSQDLDPSRPVIVMTGHSAMETALEANRQGAYHYITKPFSLSTLVRLLEAALGVAPTAARRADDDGGDGQKGR
jgi:DNA-binding NtrC family response regulator